MNIVLIGFASCGKSTAAKAVSNAMNMREIDLDRVIEDLYELQMTRSSSTTSTSPQKLSCREIYKLLGADDFAALETSALQSLVNDNTDNAVIATGGGTPINEKNHSLLKSLGKIIYIRTDIETILQRMRGKKGFPLSMGGSEDGVRSTWTTRDPVYAKVADVTVDDDEKVLEAVVSVNP